MLEGGAMNTLCTWCRTEFEPRSNGGSAQRFCKKNCRQDFNTACRMWAVQEHEAERLSVFTLRSCLGQHTRCVESGPAQERGKAPGTGVLTGGSLRADMGVTT